MTTPGDRVAETEVPPPPPSGRRRALVIGTVLVSLLALTAVMSFRWGASGAPDPAPTASPEPSAAERLSNAEIYAALAPSVVTIEALTRTTGRRHRHRRHRQRRRASS